MKRSGRNLTLLAAAVALAVVVCLLALRRDRTIEDYLHELREKGLVLDQCPRGLEPADGSRFRYAISNPTPGLEGIVYLVRYESGEAVEETVLSWRLHLIDKHAIARFNDRDEESLRWLSVSVRASASSTIGRI